MPLESATYIDGLVITNPLSTDAKSQGDDHLRLLKSTVKATFPNITGAVTPTHTELNYVDGVTSAIQTQIDTKGAIAGQAWTGSHTFPTQTAGDNSTKAATTAYVDTADALKANIDSPTFTGTVTIPAGALIDGFALIASPTFTGDPKAPTPSVGDNDTSIATTAFVRAEFALIASPTFTGTPAAPTAATGTSTTQLATTAFVGATAFNSALPSQTGNGGKYVKTDGTNASWATLPAIPAGASIYTALNFGAF